MLCAPWLLASCLPPALLLTRRPFSQGHFLTSVCDPPDSSQHHAAQRDEIWNMRQNAIGKHWHRVFREIGAIAERLERNRGQEEDRRPANFLEPVNVVDVLSRVVAN